MTEPVRTRSEVERAVYAAIIGQLSAAGLSTWMPRGPRGGQHVGPIIRHPEDLAEPIARIASAALLAMAECEHSRLLSLSAAYKLPEDCPFCHGTGLDQSRVARGLNALEGR